MINGIGPQEPQSVKPGLVKRSYEKVKEKVSSAIDAVDKYTKPRGSTAGNFEKASYFQAGFNGAIEGFYVMGPTGVITGTLPALVGVAVNNKTNSVAAGVTAGALTGFGTAFAIGTAMGGPVTGLSMGVAGTLLGAMQTFRGNADSQTRDAGGGANMVSSPFMPGPSKVAGGIGAAVGARMNSKTAKAVVGGITAAVIGGTLAAIGFAPVSIPVAAAACAAAGALGPFLGPRYSQFFRNLSSDLGNLVEKGAKKIGLVKKDIGEKQKNITGVLPASAVKEGFSGFVLSDGDPKKMAIGIIGESIKQVHMFLTSKGSNDKAAEADKHKESLLDNSPEVLGNIAGSNNSERAADTLKNQ